MAPLFPHTCPDCGSHAVERRRPRGVLERTLVPLRGRRVYQCRNCARRFHDRPSQFPGGRQPGESG